jgi:Tfp pilus assembly protein PilF
LGSALEIFASERLSAHFESDQALCRWNLCDDHAVLDYAYDLQIYGDKHELERASGILLESLVRDSSSAYRWIDFSQVLAQQGRLDQASYCMARAVDLGHESADVLDEAGSFYLLYGDPRVGLRDFARVLTMARTYDEQIFNLFDTRKVTVEDALEYGIPAEKRPVQGYLRYLMEQGRRTNAETVWKWATAHRLADLQIAAEYSTFLFRQGQFSQAATEWANAQGGLTPDYRRRDFLFNGDFSHEPLPGAIFDWELLPFEHTVISRDCVPGPDGCSLRIQFDGAANLNFNDVSQAVVLQPGKYLLRASVRAAEISTDQGPVLVVRDGENEGRLNIESGPLLGTFGWRELELPFTVGAATNFIDIRIRRHPTLRFDNKIGGTVWFRNMSLVRLQ